MALTKSQIIPRAKLTASRPTVELVIGLAIWIIGLVSTAIAFSGGWSQVLSVQPASIFEALWAIVTLQLNIPQDRWVFAIAAQLGLSYWQWTSAHRRDWQWWTSRGIDTYINWLFLNPLFAATWVALLTSVGTPLEFAGYLAMAVSAIIGWLVAYIPESTLVD